MAAVRIRLVDFYKRVAVTVCLPLHAFQVQDQLFALRINPQPSLSGLVVGLRLVPVTNNHLQSRCAGGAARLEVTDQIVNGPLRVDVISERTVGTNPTIFVGRPGMLCR